MPEMTREELRVALDWFCGCGNPDEAAKTVLDLLEMHPLHSNREKFEKLVPDDGLQYVLLYALDTMTGDTRFGIRREGWFEHGGVIGGQWLTPEGERVRDALRREYELDPDEHGDRFAALFAPHCVHGNDTDDDSHDCMAADKALGIESPHEKAAKATLTTIARTLRQVAFQGLTDEDRVQLLETAERVEHQIPDPLHPWGLGATCPICEESTCDEGCPLAEIRAAL